MKTFLISLGIFIFVNPTFAFYDSIESRPSDFGGVCSATEDCASNIGELCLPTNLVCVNGKCVCDEEISAESSNKNSENPPCLKFVGQPCNGGINSREYIAQCVNGAVCRVNLSEGFTCECAEYGDFGNGKQCERKRGHGESCLDSMACDESQNLQCDTTRGICICELGMVYSLQRCSLVPGSICIWGTPCSQNSKCNIYKVCTCDPGTSQYDNRCLVNEGGSCQIDNDNSTGNCAPGLFCRNEKCSCPYKDHQIYNKKTRSCLSLVDGPCDDNVKCVENAECVTNQVLVSCQCKSGFTGINRVCDELSFDAPCSNQENSVKCDKLAGLECGIRGKCECSDFQIYDKQEEKCKGLIGSKCNVQKVEDFCTRGAYCKEFRGDDVKSGVCVCDRRWPLQPDRTCGKIPQKDLKLEALIFEPEVSSASGRSD